MIRKLMIAATFLGLMMPAVASSPVQPEQINTYPNGFFYSSGRSYLGLEVRDITSDRVSALKLKEERGVEITMVDQDAPAGKAGLKEHDVILGYNGTKVESEEQFRRMIRETPPGRTVSLGISRDGNPMTVTAQIGDRGKLTSQMFKNGKNGTIIVAPEVHVPEMPEFNMPFDVQVMTYTPILGIQVENLNQQLGEYFGAKDGEGLLVKSVEKGSAAEKAGMKAGDVITRADNEKVSDRSDLRRILRSHRGGGKVTLGIIRDKHEQNLTIDVPARGSEDSSRLKILGPEVESLDDWKSSMEEWRPELLELGNDLRELRPQLLQAEDALKLMTPEVKKNMQQFRFNMQRWEKEMRKAAEQWRWEFHDLI